MNRADRRKLKRMNKTETETWVHEFGVSMYQEGKRDAFLVLLLKLHDSFGFGNSRIERLLAESEQWLLGIHDKNEPGVNADTIKEQLINEGIVCLKDTIL